MAVGWKRPALILWPFWQLLWSFWSSLLSFCSLFGHYYAPCPVHAHFALWSPCSLTQAWGGRLRPARSSALRTRRCWLAANCDQRDGKSELWTLPHRMLFLRLSYEFCMILYDFRMILYDLCMTLYDFCRSSVLVLYDFRMIFVLFCMMFVWLCMIFVSIRES